MDAVCQEASSNKSVELPKLNERYFEKREIADLRSHG